MSLALPLLFSKECAAVMPVCPAQTDKHMAQTGGALQQPDTLPSTSSSPHKPDCLCTASKKSLLRAT